MPMLSYIHTSMSSAIKQTKKRLQDLYDGDYIVFSDHDGAWREVINVICLRWGGPNNNTSAVSLLKRYINLTYSRVLI